MSNHSQIRSWWTVAVLWFAYALSLIDRQAITLLIDPIQRDLAINDTTIGLLHGLAFAIFYSLAGFPIARYVDRASRRVVVGGGIFFWSLGTAACGIAQNFWHLFVARISVASGEASLFPSATSLIADLFPLEKRGKAMGIFATAAFIGLGLSLIGVGLLIRALSGLDVRIPFFGQLQTWQLVFIVLGLPGLIFSLLAFSMVEPRKHARKPAFLPVREVINYLKHHRRFFAAYFLGIGLIAISVYSVLAWMPTYFMRLHGWSPQKTGITLGLIIAGPGLLSSIIGGVLADRWAARGKSDSKIRIVVIVAFVGFLPASLMTLMPTGNTAALMFAAYVLAIGVLGGLAPAIIQDVTPGPMRGQVAAIYAAILNLIGIGVGPVLVGALTDYAFGMPTAIKYSLPLVAATSTAAAGFVLMAGLTSGRRLISMLE